jgi:hypothetical protein
VCLQWVETQVCKKDGLLCAANQIMQAESGGHPALL